MRGLIISSAILLFFLPALNTPVLHAATDKSENLMAQAQRVFAPLPSDMAVSGHPFTPELVVLGRSLFFDPRISVDGTVSCARCHQPALYGTDALPRPKGAADRINPRNAPTILNAALQISEHWIGNRKDVEDQAVQALVGPPSFGNPDYASAMARIKAIPGYLPLFGKAFPKDKDPVNQTNWGTAIGAYERTLVTPSSFDAFLKGKKGALSAKAREGLRDFMETGCIACHNGPGVGGKMYDKFGKTEEYWKATGSKEIDKGRFAVTGKSDDLYVFKVPILRNVAMTPPYFHDGSMTSLPRAVRIMARVQLGKDLSDRLVTGIVTFLESLTGNLPKDFSNAPVLPPGPFKDKVEAVISDM
jgi:cytochrome c peroxidase